jgi:HD-like signal output (HDOD) protein
MSLPGAVPNFFTPEQLVAALGPLPPTAQVLARLQSLLANPNSDLGDIATLLRLDAGMTTRIIKISNSTWYSRGSPCHTIEESVNRIGFREVFQVVSIAVSSALVAQPLAAYGRDAVATWRESVSCAFAGELIAECLGEDTAASFMNGLLHAIGRQAFNRYASAAGRNFADEGFPVEFSGGEFVMLGFTQADAGACMLKKWSFTAENIEPVRRQYDPLEAAEPYDRLAAILYAARLLRTAVCSSQPVPEVSGEEEILASLRLTRDDVFPHQQSLQLKLTRAEQIARI